MLDMAERIVLGCNRDERCALVGTIGSIGGGARGMRTLVDRDVDGIAQGCCSALPESSASRRCGAIDSTSATPRACSARASCASVTS